MVDFDCQTKIVQSASNLPNKSPRSFSKIQMPSPVPPPVSCTAGELSSVSDSACNAYEQFLRLPELRRLWGSKEFPAWESESIIKPALQALEITFRFVSIVLSDPRPYANCREWGRRLELLARDQIDIIATICEAEEDDSKTRSGVPIVDLSSSHGVIARDGSSAEVWKIAGSESTVVSRKSEASLLPRLATWQKSEDITSKIAYSIECAFRRLPYTLGVGEPNLAGKPYIDYDAVCRPSELHSLKKPLLDHADNYENRILYTIHQILESWICTSKKVLERIEERINNKEYEKASCDCWLLERIWKLLEEIETLHVLMDPDDFLRLKTQLKIKSGSESDTFCFRSRGLIEITKCSKDLKHKVPEVLGVEVDPMGGPIIQEAAMKLYKEGKKSEFNKIQILQAMQAVEAALKKFFYSYKQLLVIVMGSVEAKGNRAVMVSEACDSLSQIFLEPTYYPSLDGAKTFLGDFWEHEAAEWRSQRR